MATDKTESAKTGHEKSGDAAKAANAVLKPSIAMPSTSTQIHGVDFNDYKSPITVQQLTAHFSRTGFQASNLGKAIDIINKMVYTWDI
jgi:deoxyhypusine synthase